MINHVLENGCESITNNYTSSHKAVDIVNGCTGSDDIISISDGVVEMAVRNVKYTNHNPRGAGTYGNYVKIKHPDGKKSLYAHMAYGSVNVTKGQAITKGQKIGTMGETGNAYGKHLHFEVRNSNEERENPNNYLNGNLSLDSTQTPTKTETPKEVKENIEEIHEETTSEVTEENIQNIEESENTIVADTNKEELETAITSDTNNDNNTEEKNNNIEPIEESENEKLIDEDYKEPILNLNHTSTAKKENKKETINTIENKTYKGSSIVDGLKEINIDSSFDNRSLIAEKNNIKDYHGTYNQNVYLLKLLKEGKLKY